MVFQINPIYVTKAFEFFISYMLIAFQAVVTLGVGYTLGLVVSSFIGALLSIKEFEKQLVRYGAMTSKMWGSIRSFIKHYIRWFVVALILTTTGLTITFSIYSFMTNLFWFIILTVIGLILGGVVEKTVKDAFDVVGIEDQLKKLQAESALGGIAVSSMVGAVLKWYIVLLFMGEGMMRLQLSFISDFIKDVLIYIPAAISGLVLIVVSLIVGRYASECIKSSKNPFSDLAAAAVEVMIIFFGIVISLPILKEDIDVSVLTDSFKILMAGLSLGLAIALGLGCKEYFVEQFTKSKKHG